MSVDYLRTPDERAAECMNQPASIPLDSLSLDPFANTRDSRFYYGSTSHAAAVAGLTDMLDDGNQGWGCLSSAPGLGKTLLRTVLYKSLDPLRHVAISIENALLDFDQLLLEIISQISGERVYNSDLPDRYDRLAEFKLLLTDQVVQSGRHLVLLLDEAQAFDRETLDKLRNLSNICAEQSNLMSIVLIGGTRLNATLRSLPELDQRIAVRVSLSTLDASQTVDYVQHRLRASGWQEPLPFGTDDLRALHEVSGGVPREINTIFKQAMTLARGSTCGLSGDHLREALNLRSAAGNDRKPEFQSLGMS